MTLLHPEDEGTRPSETSAIYQSTRRKIPEDFNLYTEYRFLISDFRIIMRRHHDNCLYKMASVV